nr:phosphoserine phosphatase, chloroplastic isoform X1 [Tanacetum cinerariifolium]
MHNAIADLSPEDALKRCPKVRKFTSAVTQNPLLLGEHDSDGYKVFEREPENHLTSDVEKYFTANRPCARRRVLDSGLRFFDVNAAMRPQIVQGHLQQWGFGIIFCVRFMMPLSVYAAYFDTVRAMGVPLPFEKSLASRLDLFKPLLSRVQDFLEKRTQRKASAQLAEGQDGKACSIIEHVTSGLLKGSVEFTFGNSTAFTTCCCPAIQPVKMPDSVTQFCFDAFTLVGLSL